MYVRHIESGADEKRCKHASKRIRKGSLCASNSFVVNATWERNVMEYSQRECLHTDNRSGYIGAIVDFLDSLYTAIIIQ